MSAAEQTTEHDGGNETDQQDDPSSPKFFD